MQFLEYCAALPTWAIYSANRAERAPAKAPTDFMFQAQARAELRTATASTGIPVPRQGIRYARKGERPPPSGKPNNIIEQMDAWAIRTGNMRVKHG